MPLLELLPPPKPLEAKPPPPKLPPPNPDAFLKKASSMFLTPPLTRSSLAMLLLPLLTTKANVPHGEIEMEDGWLNPVYVLLFLLVDKSSLSTLLLERFVTNA